MEGILCRYDNTSVNSFGFKSPATTPQNGHLKAFEGDIYLRNDKKDRICKC